MGQVKSKNYKPFKVTYYNEKLIVCYVLAKSKKRAKEYIREKIGVGLEIADPVRLDGGHVLPRELKFLVA